MFLWGVFSQRMLEPLRKHLYPLAGDGYIDKRAMNFLSWIDFVYH
jgi:hypothetical protein